MPHSPPSGKGGARVEFESYWRTTGSAKAVVVEFQMRGWESDLTQLWVDGAERHNEVSYELAIRDAEGALAREEDLYRRSAALSAGIDTEAIAAFNERPVDRVRRINLAVTRPTEAGAYGATDSFVHYVRQSENHWEPYIRAYPDREVLEAM